jgi:hypothetical protein
MVTAGPDAAGPRRKAGVHSDAAGVHPDTNGASLAAGAPLFVWTAELPQVRIRGAADTLAAPCGYD